MGREAEPGALTCSADSVRDPIASKRRPRPCEYAGVEEVGSVPMRSVKAAQSSVSSDPAMKPPSAPYPPSPGTCLQPARNEGALLCGLRSTPRDGTWARHVAHPTGRWRFLWALRESNPRPSPCKGETNTQVRALSCPNALPLRTAEYLAVPSARYAGVMQGPSLMSARGDVTGVGRCARRPHRQIRRPGRSHPDRSEPSHDGLGNGGTRSRSVTTAFPLGIDDCASTRHRDAVDGVHRGRGARRSADWLVDVRPTPCSLTEAAPS